MTKYPEQVKDSLYKREVQAMWYQNLSLIKPGHKTLSGSFVLQLSAFYEDSRRFHAIPATLLPITSVHYSTFIFSLYRILKNK